MPRSGSKRSTALTRPEVRDLAEVVERLARVAVLDGERARERHVQLDQARARACVTGPGASPQLPLVSGIALATLRRAI